MTKFHDELNKGAAYGKQPFIYGKAKISEGVNLWAGKWKPITKFERNIIPCLKDIIELDYRGFSINEIDEVKLSREGLAKILKESI